MTDVTTETIRPRKPLTYWLGLSAAILVTLSAISIFVWIKAEGRRQERLAIAARAAVASGNSKEAHRVLDLWLAERPDAGEAYYLKAKLELAAKHPQETINNLARALELGYPEPPLATMRAVIQANSGEVDAAEPILKRALIASNAPEPEAAAALARHYLATFKLSQASAAIERWMKDAPNDPMPYLARNEIDMRTDADHSVIIRNYQAALKRDPSLDSARLGLAERLRIAHRLDEAAEEFAAYMKRKPNDAEGVIGAGRTAIERNDLEAGKKLLDRAIELAPKDPVALSERAMVDLREGNYVQARDLLKRVIEVDPFDPEARYSLARALQLTGDAEGAKAQTEDAKRLRVEHLRMTEIRSALVKSPNDVGLRFEAAQWLLSHGHEAEGLDWASQLLKANPSHLPTHRLLLDYYLKKNDIGRANYHKLQIQTSGK
jgi:Flp pilus assembly protein TadD